MTQGRIPKPLRWRHPPGNRRPITQRVKYPTRHVTSACFVTEKERGRGKQGKKRKGGDVEGYSRGRAVTARGFGVRILPSPHVHRGLIAVLIGRSSDAIGNSTRSSGGWVGTRDMVTGIRCIGAGGYGWPIRAAPTLARGDEQRKPRKMGRPRCTAEFISPTISLIAEFSSLVDPEEIK